MVGIDVTSGAVAAVRCVRWADRDGADRLRGRMHSRKVAQCGHRLAGAAEKRYVFVAIADATDGCGIEIDPTGVYFGRRAILPAASHAGRRGPDDEDFDIEDGFFERLVWPTAGRARAGAGAAQVVNACVLPLRSRTLDTTRSWVVIPMSRASCSRAVSGTGCSIRRGSDGDGELIAHGVSHERPRALGWARVAGQAPWRKPTSLTASAMGHSRNLISVARGHVGLSAAVPALQALRHTVISLTTVSCPTIRHGQGAGSGSSGALRQMLAPS